jgi:hypothetical protein
MLELIGIIGGFLFAAGCVPMAYRTWHAGKDIGTPLETQWLLFLACIFYSIFLFGTFGASYIAFWFLAVEVVCWGVALWYHYFPRPLRWCGLCGPRRCYWPFSCGWSEAVTMGRRQEMCKHENTPNSSHGYAFCDDCGGTLPDVLYPRSAKNPGGYYAPPATNRNGRPNEEPV